MRRLVLAALLSCGGAAAVPMPVDAVDAGLPVYAGQAFCDCRFVGEVRERLGSPVARCRPFWACGIDSDATSCRELCAWGEP